MSQFSYLSTQYLEIYLFKNREEGFLTITISSDHPDGRKKQLHVDHAQLCKTLEELWVVLKKQTSKISACKIYFDEIDHYDSDVNVYYVPRADIQRGLTRAKLKEREFGSIPKDWQTNITLSFDPTLQRATPLIKCIHAVLVNWWNDKVFNTKQVKTKIQKFLNDDSARDLTISANDE